MPTSPTLRVLGVMSGSSLDGLDLALCSFMEDRNGWSYRIDAARSVPFPDDLARHLLHLTGVSAFELARTHADLGDFIGRTARELLDEHGTADLIASHGHTVFHQPASRFTTQIGCGARIAAITEVPTVVDFRTKDVALSGQGAPLVPIGERDLFPGFDAFLNLGGIANVSFHGERITGFDVGVCNQALNHLAGEVGEPYDRDGALARSGNLLPQLLERLNDQPFLQLELPRSMGREHFEEQILPMIDDRSLKLVDRLSTVVQHIAEQVARALDHGGAAKILVTGGGAHNGFLMERIKALATGSIMVPDDRTVDFKEALVFAYLGLLRWRGLPNALASVTGAARDSVGGAVYLPN